MRDERLPLAEYDSTSIHIVSANFDGNAIPGDHSNAELTHFTGEPTQYGVIHIVELYAKGAAHFFGNDAVELNRFFLSLLFAFCHK